MNSVTYQRSVPLKGHFDIAVVGGGPAGVCAAVEAARRGRSVFLAESTGMLGGMATSGLVGPFMTCYDKAGEKKIVRGLFEEIVDRAAKLSGAVDPSLTDSPSYWTSYIKRYHRHVTPFDSFILQIVLDDLVNEAGVHTLLYTRYADSICEDGKIKAAVFAAPEGLIAAKADIFIDCTGNADVASRSGVETWKGDENGEAPQPATLFFEVDNAEDDRYLAKPPKPVKAYRLPEAGCYKVNHDRVFGVDAADAQSMTEGHMKARKQILESYETLRSTEGFENCRISQTASVLGVRESRHIRGKYMLTAKDLEEGTVFEDGVMCFGYGMDVHSRDGKVAGGFRGKIADIYTVPYRCMVPVGCDNLLVAGKTICAESRAAGSFRVMPACMALGQAAGAAAGIAAEEKCGVADVPIPLLREDLIAHGAFLI